jgi:hypothetical protein
MNQTKELVRYRIASLNIPVLNGGKNKLEYYEIVITETDYIWKLWIKPYNKTDELIILNKFQTLIEELEEMTKCL